MRWCFHFINKWLNKHFQIFLVAERRIKKKFLNCYHQVYKLLVYKNTQDYDYRYDGKNHCFSDKSATDAIYSHAIIPLGNSTRNDESNNLSTSDIAYNLDNNIKTVPKTALSASVTKSSAAKNRKSSSAAPWGQVISFSLFFRLRITIGVVHCESFLRKIYVVNFVDTKLPAGKQRVKIILVYDFWIHTYGSRFWYKESTYWTIILYIVKSFIAYPS